jgi:hypothetical protein
VPFPLKALAESPEHVKFKESSHWHCQWVVTMRFTSMFELIAAAPRMQLQPLIAACSFAAPAPHRPWPGKSHQKSAAWNKEMPVQIQEK